MGTQLSLLSLATLSSGIQALSKNIKNQIDEHLSYDPEMLRGRRVIYSTSSHRQPMVEWQPSNSTPNLEHIKSNSFPTIISAIDSSTIPVCDLEDGVVYASRVAIVFSVGGRSSDCIRLGPFLFNASRDFHPPNMMKSNRLNDGMMNDGELIESMIRRVMEWESIGQISSFLNNAIILIDGTLQRTPITENWDIERMSSNAISRGNSMIGISKTSKIRSLWQLSSSLKVSDGAPFFCRIKFPTRCQVLGDTILVKFRDDGLVFRTDAISSETKKALALVSGNDSFYRGYPETLRLAHHLAVFTTYEATCIRSYLSRNLSVIELPSEDTRNTILRWFWSAGSGG